MQTRHLLFLILIGITNGQSKYDQLKYECVPGNASDVEININKTANSISGTLILTEGSNCTLQLNSDIYVLQKCRPDSPIRVIVTRPNADHVLEPGDVTTYTIGCHWNISIYIFNATAAPLPVSTRPITLNNTVQNVKFTSPYGWQPNLEMKVSPLRGITLGSDLTINISSTVKNRIKFSAESCTAFSPSHHLILWTSENCSTVYKELFQTESWTFDEKSDSITHHLQAFRFTDSEIVTLQCEIKICPIGQESSCNYGCKDTGTQRTRRAAAGRTTTLKTSFSVVDSLAIENISNTAPGYYLTTPLMSMVFLLNTYMHLF